MGGSSAFEWDQAKAARNPRKHGVTFEDAATTFADPNSLTVADPIHSDFEERHILIGRSIEERLLVVVHVDRGETIRIISARRAMWRERLSYEQA